MSKIIFKVLDSDLSKDEQVWYKSKRCMPWSNVELDTTKKHGEIAGMTLEINIGDVAYLYVNYYNKDGTISDYKERYIIHNEKDDTPITIPVRLQDYYAKGMLNGEILPTGGGVIIR